MNKEDRRSLIAGVVAAIALTVLVVTSWRAVSAVLDEHAYAAAPPCAAAVTTGDCREETVGTVLGVTETGGRDAVYRLDVDTASGPVEVRFASGNAVLANAVDGDSVTLTSWHGRTVSAAGKGGSAETSDAPRVRFASMLGYALLALGCADYGLLVASLPWLTRRYGHGRIVGRDATGRRAAVRGFVFVLVSVGGLVPLVAGPVQVGTGPQGTVPVLVGGGVASCAVLVLARRFATGGRRRPAAPTTAPTATPAATPAVAPRAFPGHRVRRRLPLRLRLRFRRRAGSRPAGLLPNLPLPAFERSRWCAWGLPLLGGGGLAVVLMATVPVLDAGAYRTAPPCVGQVVTTDCRGLVPMTVNGVRTPAGSGWPAVSLVTPDGHLNTWATFDVGPLVLRAAQLQSARTVLPVHVWRRRVLGVDLGGATDWAAGAPPEAALGLAALGTVLGLFVLLNRVRVRARNRSGATRVRRLLAEDAAQFGLSALGLWLLGEGFVWGLAPLLAAPVWSLSSVRQAWAGERARGYVPVLAGHTEREPVLMSRTLAEWFGELADAPLLLEPRDHRAESLVNRVVLQPELLEDPAAEDLPSLFEGLVAALRERLTAAGRGGPAVFYACLPAGGRSLFCGASSSSSVRPLVGSAPRLRVDSPAELVACWRDRAEKWHEDGDDEDGGHEDGEHEDGDDEDGAVVAGQTRVPIWLVELA